MMEKTSIDLDSQLEEMRELAKKDPYYEMARDIFERSPYFHLSEEERPKYTALHSSKGTVYGQ